MKWYGIVNNGAHSLIMNAISDYYYKVVDYDYIASRNDDYDYLRVCNLIHTG